MWVEPWIRSFFGPWPLDFGLQQNKNALYGRFILAGDPTGIRTRTTNVRGWRPNH